MTRFSACDATRMTALENIAEGGRSPQVNTTYEKALLRKIVGRRILTGGAGDRRRPSNGHVLVHA